MVGVTTMAARTAVTVGGLSYSIQDVRVASSLAPEGMEKRYS